jgi:hypothetical protein
MTVTVSDIPASSLLDDALVCSAYFKDSYSVPLTHAEFSPTLLFQHLFNHHPIWVKALLIARNKVAAYCGLDVAPAAKIINADTRTDYTVGDTIGPWPIFALTENELIAGRDNRHLDFRLSVLKASANGAPHVFVSTICSVNHWSGKAYLFFIVPFHKWGVRKLITDAVAAGRL